MQYECSLLYFVTHALSASGSTKRTRRESSEATDIVTLLGLSGRSEKKNTKGNETKYRYLVAVYEC